MTESEKITEYIIRTHPPLRGPPSLSEKAIDSFIMVSYTLKRKKYYEVSTILKKA